MSLTDDIYRELMDGLGKDLDYTHFQVKYQNKKGPFYNALRRFTRDMEPKVRELGGVQAKLDAVGLTLDSLNQRKKEAQSNIASLEEEENILNEGIETLETELAEKSGLSKHLAELERLGFNIERLSLLSDALREIGAKHGFKSKEAASKFFDDLKDYDLVLEVEAQLKGLQTQIETKKLEAENWQAKEELFKRKHDDLKETIEAVGALRTRGIKPSQIIVWHRILSRFQTVEEFDQSLTQYGNTTKLLNEKQEETENWELRLANAQGQVEILKKEKAKIEGAIDALKEAGAKQLRAMTEEYTKQLQIMTGEATKQLKTLAKNEKTEIREVGQEVRNEFDDFSYQLDVSIKKVFDMGQEFERKKRELQKYEGLKDVLESHVVSSEEEEKE